MSWEVDNRVANGIGLLGSFTAIVMWMSPIRDVFTAQHSILKTRSTEHVATGFGFVAGTFNCILWNLFACNRLDTMLVPFIVNCIGFALNFSFVVCYYWFGEVKARSETRSQFTWFVAVTGLALATWYVDKNNDMVGYFAAFVNVFMLFGPLAAARDIIKARSSKGMSLLPMIMTLVSSIVWCSYGIYIKVIPSIIPNALGVFFGIMQLVLYAWARKQDRKSLEEEILDEEFQPVSGRDVLHQRQRVASLGSLIAEGP